MFIENLALNNYRNYDNADIPESAIPVAFKACPSFMNSSLSLNFKI